MSNTVAYYLDPYGTDTQLLAAPKMCRAFPRNAEFNSAHDVD
jgi:hypothetical protein